MRRVVSILLVVLVSLAPVATRAEPGRSAASLGGAGSAAAPLGFQIFCLTHPEHCRRGQRPEVVLTQEVYDLLGAVNREVNQAIHARDDGSDTWSINVAQGDCEDFALTKRVQLIAAGVPPGALRIGIGTYRGEGHAVLVVRTNAGDLVLDNMTSAIRPWRESGIRWVAMSSIDPLVWHAAH